MIVVADSSPLISFAVLGKLELLTNIFDDIVVPKAVFDEVVIPNKPYYDSLKGFLTNKIEFVKNEIGVKLLLKEVELGESETIILALEKKICNVLMDDYKGRRIAEINGLYPIGTIGVLLQAKKLGFIKEIKPLLAELIKNKIRIGISLYKKALELAKENIS